MKLKRLLESIPKGAKVGAFYLRAKDGTVYTKWWGDNEIVLGGLTRLIHEINCEVDEEADPPSFVGVSEIEMEPTLGLGVAPEKAPEGEIEGLPGLGTYL